MSKRQIFRIEVPETNSNVIERKVQQTRLDEIKDQLDTTLKYGFFNYIDDINPTNIFKYLIILQLSIFVFKLIPIKLNHVIGLVTGIVLIFFLNEKNRTETMTELKELEIKMERIEPRPKYFYMDANIIDLIFNILDFRKYNEQAFTNLIKFTDNFLLIRRDIELGSLYCNDNIDVAKDMSKHALNSLHSIIHKLPSSNVLEIKLKNALRTLQLYFKRHLHFMIDKCNQQINKHGHNKITKIIYTDQPEPVDKMYNSHYNIF